MQWAKIFKQLFLSVAWQCGAMATLRDREVPPPLDSVGSFGQRCYDLNLLETV